MQTKELDLLKEHNATMILKLEKSAGELKEKNLRIGTANLFDQGWNHYHIWKGQIWRWGAGSYHGPSRYECFHEQSQWSDSHSFTEIR